MKKQFAFLFIFCALIFGTSTTALAATSGLPLVVKDGHQTFPRIDGPYVVYGDNDGLGWGLSFVNTASNEQRTIVSSATGGVGFAGAYNISGTKIVYSLSYSSGSAIYLYDIQTGTSKKISNDGYTPSISGNYIVWYSIQNGNVVVLYDVALDKTTEITTRGTFGAPGGFVRPVVSGDKIVYEADANGKPADLYLYDISLGQSSKIGVGLMPRIYGDYVIWSGFGNADPITLYQISTQAQKVIGTGQAGEIYGDSVVYWSAADNEVHLYSISSDKTTVGFGTGGGFTGPDIHGTTLVWADNRTSPPNLPTWPLTDIYSIDTAPPLSCTAWTYSDWSSCTSSGSQTRSVISSSPNSCTGGSPVVSQSCTYVAPVTACTLSDWSCGSWGTCSVNGSQTKTCTKISNCQGGVVSPATSQSCVVPQQAPATTPSVYQAPQPSCTADTWNCDGWNSCSLSGIQNRSCRKTFDCPNVETAPPVADQYCEAPNRPVQQVPQDSSAIANQDTIVKATVKLLCPFDERGERWSQGSGTVIDQSGTILTNKHVVDGTLGCFVGFVSDFNDEPYFEDRQIADIQKISSSEDVAILKLRNPQGKKLAYVDIKKSDSNIRLGTKVNVYGYPAKFGTNITYTSGDFSGTGGSYLKTTAIIEHGNSGGGSYLNDGNFIGVPSAVLRGELNAMGQILSINTINAWLGNSTIARSSNGSQNNFSRVSSILETMDLKKLDSVKLIVPKIDDKGNNLTIPAPAQNTQNPEVKPQVNQTQTSNTQQFSRTLSVGSRGDDVTALQQILISGGFLSGTTTGYFGQMTKAAVSAYQKQNGMEAIGVVGPKSRALLNREGR